MQHTDSATYRFEFRGTLEIPHAVLLTHRKGSLRDALALCDEYACQILLHDDSGIRGWVEPDGKYSLA